MSNDYLTVSQLTMYIQEKISDDSNLRNIYIKGELSNVKLYNNGHFYFTLKDDSSQIKGVMFAARYKLKFRPKDGMDVLIKGKIGVYLPYGTYQLYAESISQVGIGQLHIAFEQLKEKLAKEGLFDESHKKLIPQFPKRIGVVTAVNGAAIRDIITTITRRWPICEVILFPSLVQGESACENIVYKIKQADKYDLDTLIVGRGGGSIEDLWSFNEEIVARAIYNAQTPIISAVGHEIDFTIADFVSDLRAPTPTAAAEIATPNINEIKTYFNQFKSKIFNLIIQQFEDNKDNFTSIINNDLFKNPQKIYQSKEILLDDLIAKLGYSSKNIVLSNKTKLELLENNHYLINPYEIINKKREKYFHAIDKLEVLNPLNTLKRGYALVKIDDKIISSSADLHDEDIIEIEFHDGKVNTKLI